jgi:hypothetical protein
MTTAVFPYEADLCLALNRGLRAVLPRRPSPDEAFFVAEEVHVGTIIADVVILKTSRSRVIGSAAKRPSLSLFEACVLAELLAGEPRRFNTLVNRTALRSQTADAALTRLSKIGMVRRTASGAYALADSGILPSGHLIAIEAKLTRWRDAISQAEAYLTFANQSFVALPKAVVETAGGLRQACRLAGVGLLSVSYRNVEVALEAPVTSQSSAEWLWVMSKSTPLLRPLH